MEIVNEEVCQEQHEGREKKEGEFKVKEKK